MQENIKKTVSRQPGRPAIHTLLLQRKSVREFDTAMPDRTELQTLFEAARWAPSSHNEQPWRFLVVTKEDEKAFATMLLCLGERNREWAKEAPVLVLGVAKLNFTHRETVNRHAFYDLGQAVAHLTVQAVALGMGVHQMGGFDIERARKDFAMPEGYEPVVVLAIGYPKVSEDSNGPVGSSGSVRQRRQITDLVFGQKWGTPSTRVLLQD